MLTRSILAIPLLACTALALDGPVLWRSPEDMALAPMYARPTGPEAFDAAQQSGWAVVFFYRQAYCIPPNFNLMNLLDPTPGPAPFRYQAQVCPQVVSGKHFFANANDLQNNRAPLLFILEGSYASVVVLVPIKDYIAAVQDNQLTLVKLMNIPSRLVGNAYTYREVHMPQPTAAGGGNQQPAVEYSADGMLLDGRTFHVHIASRAPEPGKPVFSDFTVEIH